MAEAPLHLFVSPHLDDVALSCGGLVYRLTRRGHRVVIATLVTAEPPLDGLSRLARRHHTGWDLGHQPFAARRREDERACRVLGGQPRHLNLMDALYRRDQAGKPFYGRTIVGGVADPADAEATVPLIAAELEAVAGSLGVVPAAVAAPLGLGGHVDHLLARAAVERLWPAEQRVYYEDFPYAARTRGRPAGVLRSEVVRLTDEELDARLRAVGEYVSQLPLLFPSPIDSAREIARARLPLLRAVVPALPRGERAAARMRAALRAHVAAVGGERYWLSERSSAWSALSAPAAP